MYCTSQVTTWTSNNFWAQGDTENAQKHSLLVSFPDPNNPSVDHFQYRSLHVPRQQKHSCNSTLTN